MKKPDFIQSLRSQVGELHRWEEDVDDLLRLAAWSRVTEKLIPGTIQPWEDTLKKIEKIAEAEQQKGDIEKIKQTHWTIVEHDIKRDNEYIQVDSLNSTVYEIDQYYPLMTLQASQEEINQAKRIGYYLFIPTVQHLLIREVKQHPKVTEAIKKELKFIGAIEESIHGYGIRYWLPFAVGLKSEEYWKLKIAMADSKATSIVEGYLKRQDNFDKMMLKEASYLITQAQQHLVLLPERVNLGTLQGAFFALKKYQEIIDIKLRLGSLQYTHLKRRIIFLIVYLSKLKHELNTNVIAFGGAFYNHTTRFCSLYTGVTHWDNYMLPSIMEQESNFVVSDAEDIMDEKKVKHILYDRDLDNSMIEFLTHNYNYLLKEGK